MASLWSLLLFFIITKRSSASSCCCSITKLLLGGEYTTIDVSFPYDNRTVYFKNVEKREQTPAVLMLGGTYIEAPSAYYENGDSITEVSSVRLIIQLIVIDLSTKVKDDPKYVLQMRDIDAALDPGALEYMRLRKTLLVLKFGWSKYYHDDKYLGYVKEDDAYSFPVISYEVAEWITTNEKTRNVVGLGVDLPNIERESTKGFPAHERLAKANIYVIENLNLTMHLPSYRCTVGAFPLRKKEKSRAPISVAAVCPNDPSVECYGKINKRDDHDDHESEHTIHRRCKCKSHHHDEVQELHESHKEHEHKTDGQGDKEPNKQENIDKGPSKSQNNKNSTIDETNNSGSDNQGLNNKEPIKQENNKKEPNKQEGSKNKESTSGAQGPQNLISSVLKFKENLILKDQESKSNSSI